MKRWIPLAALALSGWGQTAEKALFTLNDYPGLDVYGVFQPGAEIGATCSLFAYDQNMAMYLKATGREGIADAADKVAADESARACDDDGEVLAHVISLRNRVEKGFAGETGDDAPVNLFGER